jgi:AFG3 family protein
MNTMFVKNFIFYFIISYMLGILIICISSFIKSYKSNSTDSFTQMNYDINIINGSGTKNRDLDFSKKKKISFDDVIGLESVKKELKYYLDFIKNRQKYLKHNVKLPKGVLLVGPPGTGKTLLVKALASEAGIDLLQTSGSEFVEIYVGVGAARIRKLFENARSKKNCIIFIDEIDAVGRKRSDLNRDNSERDNTLNQLLVEMDGFNASSNIIVFAATNIVKTLDPALLRSGRFDKKVIFDSPNVDEREKMFELYLNSININKSVDKRDLAKRSAGLTGADIANVSNQAKILAIRRITESKTNKNGKIVLTTEDINKAIDEVMIGMEKRERQMTDEEKNIVSHHEAGHALMGYLLKNSSPPIKVSIIPRGEAALGFSQPEPRDKKLYKYVDLYDQICVFLGGRVAEEVIFGSITTGASDDIERLTRIAYGMVVRYGMVEELGAVNYTDVAKISSEVRAKIDTKVKEIVNSAYNRTRQILQDHKENIEKLGKKLLETETLLLKDIEELIDPKLRDSISNEDLMFKTIEEKEINKVKA